MCVSQQTMGKPKTVLIICFHYFSTSKPNLLAKILWQSKVHILMLAQIWAWWPFLCAWGRISHNFWHCSKYIKCEKVRFVHVRTLVFAYIILFAFLTNEGSFWLEIYVYILSVLWYTSLKMQIRKNIYTHVCTAHMKPTTVFFLANNVLPTFYQCTSHRIIYNWT